VLEDQEISREADQARIVHLQKLMLKAKGAIQSYQEKNNILEASLNEAEAKVSELEGTIARLNANEPLSSDSVVTVLARVKVADVIWANVRMERSGLKWYKEQALMKLPRHLPEVLDDQFRASVVAGQIKQVASQYEDRLQRMQKANEASEEQFRDLQRAYKDLQMGYSQLQKEQADKPFEELSSLTARSSKLRDMLIQAVQQDEAIDLQSMQRTIREFADGPVPAAFADLRDHITSLHLSVIDLARRLLHSRTELSTQEAAWKASFGSLVNEKEELKTTLSRVRLELSRK
jgi:chromosome segregation ATPase